MRSPIALIALFALLQSCGGRFTIADDAKADPARHSALYAAITSRDLARVQSAIAGGANVRMRDLQGAMALHWAAQVSCAGCVEIVAKAGAPVDAINQYGKRPIDVAILVKCLACTKELITAGANVNASSSARLPPLFAAAGGGSDALVGLLLSSGADADARDSGGQTVLHAGAIYPKVIEVLLKTRVDVNVPDATGATALHRASRTYHPLIGRQGSSVPLLLRAGAEIDAVDSLGNTPLHMAAKSADLESTRALLEAHANPNIRNLAEQTPLRLATNVASRLITGSGDAATRARQVVDLLRAAGGTLP